VLQPLIRPVSDSSGKVRLFGVLSLPCDPEEEHAVQVAEAAAEERVCRLVLRQAGVVLDGYDDGGAGTRTGDGDGSSSDSSESGDKDSGNCIVTWQAGVHRQLGAGVQLGPTRNENDDDDDPLNRSGFVPTKKTKNRSVTHGNGNGDDDDDNESVLDSDTCDGPSGVDSDGGLSLPAMRENFKGTGPSRERMMEAATVTAMSAAFATGRGVGHLAYDAGLADSVSSLSSSADFTDEDEGGSEPEPEPETKHRPRIQSDSGSDLDSEAGSHTHSVRRTRHLRGFLRGDPTSSQEAAGGAGEGGFSAHGGIDWEQEDGFLAAGVLVGKGSGRRRGGARSLTGRNTAAADRSRGMRAETELARNETKAGGRWKLAMQGVMEGGRSFNREGETSGASDGASIGRRLRRLSWIGESGGGGGARSTRFRRSSTGEGDESIS